MRTTRLLPAAALLSSVLLLGGCTAIGNLFGGDQAVRDADSGEVTDAGKGDVFALKVGDCFDDEAGTEVSELPLKPCSGPHDFETYYDFSLPGDEYPGMSEIDSQAETECGAAFDDFVGIPYEESTLGYSYLTPTQKSWEQGGDRLVSCYVGDPAGPVSGSLAGAAR
ncbi:septum formation family protein [Microbacterium sp. SORGH_AS_0888]|uniref:septum formation family protein n=1 Tax=Microbacterium sp. SORGH_AS_0888 TaxID=3041791 RepID=UPI00278777A2|nr:septum formation family protein [Microbacterium sp. SORGH_AS_0888]MDQ1129877.1 hypothetical protein [Microbacterium sp. SORGH_AS_0888]